MTMMVRLTVKIQIAQVPHSVRDKARRQTVRMVLTMMATVPSTVSTVTVPLIQPVKMLSLTVQMVRTTTMMVM